MKKKYTLMHFLFIITISAFSQTLSVVTPTDLSTNVSTTIILTFENSSVGNTVANPDRTYIELSKLNNFDNSQNSIDYQKSDLWVKNNNEVKTMNFQITNQLATNTVYYIRAKSTKNGFSKITSFTTTSSNIMSITSPTNNQSNIILKPTISGTSSSKNNSTVSPDKIKVQISDVADFNKTNPLNYYEESSFLIKTDDVVKNFNWSPTNYLQGNKVYYTRLYSTKYGFSNTITFTTISLIKPSIIEPSNNSTDIIRSPKISATYSGTNNSAISPDNLYFEISKNISFSKSQSLPNYQKSSIWSKTDDALNTYDWYSTATLEANTEYYTRMYSSKSGFSSIVKFTTGINAILEITQPINNQTDTDVYPTISAINRSINNSVLSADQIYLEIAKDINFTTNINTAIYQKSGFWNKTTNSDLNMNWTLGDVLSYNTTYFARAKSSKYGYSDIITFTTKKFANTLLNEINDISATGSSLYLNQFTSKFVASNVTDANSYHWKFDDNNDFSSPELDTTTSTNTLNLSTLRLSSAQLYNVLVIAKNTATNDSSDSNTSTIIQFTNSLHPIQLALPTKTFNRRTTKLWISPQNNATEYLFQVSGKGDFSTLYTTSASTTQEGIDGPVFKNNSLWYLGTGATPSETIQYYVFDYIPAITSDTLFVRSCGANSNQKGYWYKADTIIITAPKIPYVTNIANNALVDSNITFKIYNDPNFTETGYSFQVATQSNFTSSSLVMNYTNWTMGDSIPNKKLKSNIQYYARVKAIYSNASTSPWSQTLNFTTKGNINLRTNDIIFENRLSENRYVSPNPFQNQIEVNSSTKILTIKIYDEMGALNIDTPVDNQLKTVVNTESLKSGLYILSIETKENITRTKIYKK